MTDFLWLIPVFPLAGFLINGFFGSRLSERAVGAIGAGAVALSFVTGALLLRELLSLDPHDRLFVQSMYTWMATGSLSIEVAFRFDALSAVMTMVVTGVGFLIHVYSIGYMAE